MRRLLLAAGFLWSTALGAQEQPVNIGEPSVIPEADEPAPAPTPAPPSIRVRALAGGLTALATDTKTSVEPLASLQVEAPLSTSFRGPKLSVQLDLTALPGEAIDMADPSTFNALELGVAIVQPLPRPLLFSVYAEGGFASRLATSEEPVTRLPSWWSFGFVFATKDGDHALKIGAGPDERLSGEWAATVHVSGRAKIQQVGSVSVYVVGSALRALDLAAYGYRTPARDSIRLGVALGTR